MTHKKQRQIEAWLRSYFRRRANKAGLRSPTLDRESRGGRPDVATAAAIERMDAAATKALNELHPHDRRLLAAIYFGELSIPDVAQRLCRTEQAVSADVDRCLMHLCGEAAQPQKPRTRRLYRTEAASLAGVHPDTLARHTSPDIADRPDGGWWLYKRPLFEKYAGAFTLDEVAEAEAAVMGRPVTTRTVKRWIRSGKLEPVRLESKALFADRVSRESWINYALDRLWARHFARDVSDLEQGSRRALAMAGQGRIGVPDELRTSAGLLAARAREWERLVIALAARADEIGARTLRDFGLPLPMNAERYRIAFREIRAQSIPTLERKREVLVFLAGTTEKLAQCSPAPSDEMLRAKIDKARADIAAQIAEVTEEIAVLRRDAKAAKRHDRAA